MPKEGFQQELDEPAAGVLALGEQVQGSLENMVKAIERRDAEQEAGVDARYKARVADVARESTGATHVIEIVS
jgi:hypothetical protein